MLSLKEILKYYSADLQIFEQFIFKEYLQYLILKIIFNTKYASKLAFLGGTNLRIVHNNQRFSEDLDFDNLGLEYEDFANLSKIIQKELDKEWLTVEIKNVCKGAYHCYVKIPKILKKIWFSNLDDEKILIQIDTAPHNFSYKPEIKILNKFWLVFPVKNTPLEIIASQKIYAIFNRKRPKGRDFFDLVFILWQTKPNFPYLKAKLGFKNYETVKKELLSFCESLNFKELTDDVEPFLFQKEGRNNIKFFKEIISECL